MNNSNQNPYGPPPSRDAHAPRDAHAAVQRPQQGSVPQHDGYAAAPQPGAPMHPYGDPNAPSSYGPMPVQYGHPGYGAPMGYGAPAPINIVVQNTATANMSGGLVRVSNKSKGVAALLAFFFGGLGFHKFYLGQPITGLLYLFFCWTFVPMFLGFLEALLYLTMSGHSFDMKYNARLA